jgi:AAA family ATP:ADP antiporter
LPYLGFVFYVWLGIFNMAAPAQFWGFANDIYTRKAGERLFPIIAVGATLGAPFGARIAGDLFRMGISPYTMMQITAAMLVVHLLLYLWVNRREARRPAQAQAASVALGGTGGFGLVMQSPYIRLIALLLIVLNLVNTTGEYIISRTVVAAANTAAAANPALDKGAFIGSFYGSYNFWVAVIALLVQAFVVSRIVKYLGLAGAILALPLISLGAYSLIFAGASFAVTRWAKTAENAGDYSVMNTGKQMLWLPTSREEKYKAKQAVDTFFVRFGDMLSAGLVFAGTTWLAFDVRGFAFTNVVLAMLWIGVAVLLLRENRRLIARREELAA